MFRAIAPSESGINPAHIKKFINLLENNGYNMHSMLIIRGDDIFCEAYWEPYTRDSVQRMYLLCRQYCAKYRSVPRELRGLIYCKEKIDYKKR